MVPIVLVVDDDERARRLVRMGLELEGLAVVEAETLERARAVIHSNMAGVVLDRQLPDGDGLDLLSTIGSTCPDAQIVLHSTVRDGREPPGMESVDKGDLPAIVRALGFPDHGESMGDELRRPVVDLVRAEAEGVARDWAELCRWDPLLPPDTSPAAASQVVEAVVEALQRPQPLGWGPDPALTRITEIFAESAGAVDIAIGQLICLREAFRRHVDRHVPADERPETQARIDMIVDRAIWTASRVAAARLARRLQVDALTGLGNRAAFEDVVTRELHRATRYGRPLSIIDVEVAAAVIGDQVDVDAEAQLRRMAGVLVRNVRAQDLVHRVGPVTFAVIAPETGADGAALLAGRLAAVPLPGISVGTATAPDDGCDYVTLLDTAAGRALTTSV